jgi:hypothetical protein
MVGMHLVLSMIGLFRFRDKRIYAQRLLRLTYSTAGSMRPPNAWQGVALYLLGCVVYSAKVNAVKACVDTGVKHAIFNPIYEVAF